MINLVIPTIELKEKALQYRQEHFDYGEQIINGSELFDKTEHYEAWLQAVTANRRAETVNPDWVVTDTYFAIDEEGEIVGIIDLRHELNDFLKDLGHCGYSVRPFKRNRGYGSEMLRQILDIARNVGLQELQLSVEKSNTASIKTIMKNGGIYERSFVFAGQEAEVYKIYL